MAAAAVQPAAVLAVQPAAAQAVQPAAEAAALPAVKLAAVALPVVAPVVQLAVAAVEQQADAPVAAGAAKWAALNHDARTQRQTRNPRSSSYPPLAVSFDLSASLQAGGRSVPPLRA